MKSGVKHYLLKPCDEEQLRSALQEIMELKQEQPFRMPRYNM